MISKSNIVRIYGLLAAIFAPLVTLIIYRRWPNMPTWLIALALIALSICFYSLGILYGNRPDEVRKKVPISSKELARRKKKFYDWIDSLGRR